MKKSLIDLREEMRAVARGEREPAPRPAASLLKALSPEALELVELLLQERPSTINEITELTGRAQSNVSRSLQQLARLGLVVLERSGKQVRPVPTASRVQIDLATGTYETTPLEAEVA